MDIARPDSLKRKRTRQIGYGATALVVVVLMVVGVSRLKPAAPGIERATLWIDTVQRGPMIRQVRGSGTLVPEDLRWIPAATSGRVERIIVQPGSEVTANTVMLELSNPALEQELQDAQLKVKSAEASLANLRVQLETEQLQQRRVHLDHRSGLPEGGAPGGNQQAARATSSWSRPSRCSSRSSTRSCWRSRYDIAKKQLVKDIESMEARLAAAAIRPSIRFAR